jgi:hypothetical protein
VLSTHESPQLVIGNIHIKGHKTNLVPRCNHGNELVSHPISQLVIIRKGDHHLPWLGLVLLEYFAVH